MGSSVANTFTKSTQVIVRYQVDLLRAHQAELGLKEVYYGDQEKIPDFPSVGVEGFPKQRRIIGTHQFEVTLRTGIYLYHGALQASYTTKEEADLLVEAIEDTLHADYTLDGLVVFGYVTRTAPGFAMKDVMVRTVRLEWESTSRELFR